MVVSVCPVSVQCLSRCNQGSSANKIACLAILASDWPRAYDLKASACQSGLTVLQVWFGCKWLYASFSLVESGCILASNWLKVVVC